MHPQLNVVEFATPDDLAAAADLPACERPAQPNAERGLKAALIDGRPEGSQPRDDRPLLLLIQRSGDDASEILDYLERDAFRVRPATRDPGVVVVVKESHPDVIVLQADGTNNGVQLMRQILREVAVPVIIVAARESADSVEALDHGADDYMVEPAALPEIAARARGAIRRARRLPGQRVQRVGALELDGRARRARTGGRRLALTPWEYTILEFLARTPGEVVPGVELTKAGGECKANSAAALGQRIRRLRTKLCAAGVNDPFITAVHGVGYRLDSC